MALHVRTGTGFRWRPTALGGEARDVVRVLDDGGVQLALMANGFDSMFSTCSPPTSRRILDLFVEAWGETSGAIRDRLLAAFERARERFADLARPRMVVEADALEDGPDAVLLAVAIEGTTAHMAWIGGDIALVARGFEVLAQTTPHTVVERFRREAPDVDLSDAPDVLTRTISDGAAPDYLEAEVAAGSSLVLVSRAVFRGPCVSAEDASFAATAYAAPAILAERLAEIGFAKTDAPYATVAVLRFDDLDLARAIDRLLEAYEPDREHGWLRAWSRTNRALPVAFDMGGALAMRRDGSIVSVSWDAPEAPVREEVSGAAALAAVIGAARRYEELATLAPKLRSDAASCAHCERLSPDGRSGCPMCWYLGKVVRPPPSWF